MYKLYCPTVLLKWVDVGKKILERWIVSNNNITNGSVYRLQAHAKHSFAFPNSL